MQRISVRAKVCTGSDLDGSSLATQLEIFSTAGKSSSQDVYKLSDIVKFFKTLTPSQIELMSQCVKPLGYFWSCQPLMLQANAHLVHLEG